MGLGLSGRSTSSSARWRCEAVMSSGTHRTGGQERSVAEGGAGRSRGGFAARLPAYTRFMIAIPVLGLLAGAVTLTVVAASKTVHTIGQIIQGGLHEKEAVLVFIELADVFLLATVLYIMSLGLYELFIDDTAPMPEWLQIHSLDDLKSKLVGVVAVVLAVSFLGVVIRGVDATALMHEGIGIGAVVASMGYFLSRGGHS